MTYRVPFLDAWPPAATRTSTLLQDGFLRSRGRVPHAPALSIGGTVHTYEELHGLATRIATALREHATAPPGGLTAVLAHRSATAYAGVLAALLRGHGYVPLSPSHPSRRTRSLLERAGCDALVVDRAGARQLRNLLADLRPMVVALPAHDAVEVDALATLLPAHRLLSARDLLPPSLAGPAPPHPDPDQPAYLLFTSGTTGTPKAVAVTHTNARHLLAWAARRYQLSPGDRVAQHADLTFDASVLDMFATWDAGACLCVPSHRGVPEVADFIRTNQVTVWHSVPSVAVYMRHLGMLQPGSLPSLRWTLFGGEPLTLEVAQCWSTAAPNSAIDNVYGPTEATVDATVYRYDPRTTPDHSELGWVPIGAPLPAMEALVVDESLNEVPPGAIGELLLAGPQVTAGYWRDPDRTRTAYTVPPKRYRRFYRTGDRVRRPLPGEPLRFIGRLDGQIKVNGHRVELGEVEQALRHAVRSDHVAVVGWPTVDGAGAAAGLEAFVARGDVEVLEIRRRMAQILPPYMVPRRVHLLPELPLNANGKIDRTALCSRLEKAT